MILRRIVIGDKKGDALLNNVLTALIAVLGMSAIAFGVWRLYSVYADQDERNAQTIANTIEAKVNAIKEGESAKFVVKGVGGWFIAGWGSSESPRPDACFFKSCVCVCKESDSSGLGGNSEGFMLDSCREKGFCRLFDVDKVDTFHRDIYYPPTAAPPVESNIRRINLPKDKLVELSATKKKEGDKETLTLALSGQ